MKVHFSEPGDAAKKAIRRRIHRYWIVNKDIVHGLMPWTRWWETSATRNPEPFASTIIYILDIIDNKVIYAPTNLRDLYVIGSRTWPLKEKMLEVMADRAKFKQSRRKIVNYQKEISK